MVNRCFRLSAGDGEQFFVVQSDVFLSCPFQPSDSCIGFGREKILWKLQTFSLRRCTFVYNVFVALGVTGTLPRQSLELEFQICTVV